VYEQLSKLEASNDKMLYLWFEPWAEGLGFPAGSVVELRAVSTVGENWSSTPAKVERLCTDGQEALWKSR